MEWDYALGLIKIDGLTSTRSVKKYFSRMYFIMYISVVLPFVAIAQEKNIDSATKQCYSFVEIDSLFLNGKDIRLKKICIPNITFEFNKSNLDVKSRKTLDEIIFWFKKYPFITIAINGHTDGVGGDRFNMELSQKRAETVYNYLAQKGISKRRLTYNFYGKTNPISNNDTDAGRAKNRRVEIDMRIASNIDEITSEYFTVEKGIYKPETMPTPTVSQQLGAFTVNKTVIPGGSTYLTVTTDETIEEFYLTVDKINGHLIVPAEKNDDNKYFMLLLISQYLDRSFNIIVSGKNSNEDIFAPISENIKYVEAGSGALQISLSFDNNIDLDLHVVQPNGERIYFGNRGGDDWGLDIDSNANCTIDGLNNENIFFKANQVLKGKYEVWVNLYKNCNNITTKWVVIATYNGTLINPVWGKNPATGIFPANAADNMVNDLTGAIKIMEFNVE